MPCRQHEPLATTCGSGPRRQLFLQACCLRTFRGPLRRVVRQERSRGAHSSMVEASCVPRRKSEDHAPRFAVATDEDVEDGRLLDQHGKSVPSRNAGSTAAALGRGAVERGKALGPAASAGVLAACRARLRGGRDLASRRPFWLRAVRGHVRPRGRACRERVARDGETSRHVSAPVPSACRTRSSAIGRRYASPHTARLIANARS